MDTTMEDVWGCVSNALKEDKYPGAEYLRENLTHIKETINSNPTGCVLVIRDEDDENKMLGLAGVTTGCCIVHLHFVYVIPEERNSAVFAEVMAEVKRFGQYNYYGFVSVLCPDGYGLSSAHDLFSGLAASAIPEETLAGSSVVKYMIPKVEWEKFF